MVDERKFNCPWHLMNIFTPSMGSCGLKDCELQNFENQGEHIVIFVCKLSPVPPTNFD